jgi:hypothetical protein
MSDLDDKLDELEKKISDKRKSKKENDDKRKLEEETEEKRVHEFWIKEFTDNKDFNEKVDKIISKFTKINPLKYYSCENFVPNKDFPYINLFYLKFILDNSHVKLRIFPMTPVRTVFQVNKHLEHNGSSIDVEVNFDKDNINYLSDEERIKKIGNYQLDEVNEAKKVFFEKIIELFEIENKNIY